VDSHPYFVRRCRCRFRPGAPLRCYNGHKNWLLGWYPSKRLAVPGAAKIRLAAFVDVQLAASNEYVLLNVQNNKYFVQYNRAKKHNVGTQIAQDRVTVTVPAGAGTSNQVAALAVGESYGSVIRVCSAETTASGADVVVVAIGMAC
jgi:hypothetical protein